jgi:hypothetical protein
MKVGGIWKIVTRYAFIDVGQGSMVNTLTIQPEIIGQYYVSNRGANTLD